MPHSFETVPSHPQLFEKMKTRYFLIPTKLMLLATMILLLGSRMTPEEPFDPTKIEEHLKTNKFFWFMQCVPNEPNQKLEIRPVFIEAQGCYAIKNGEPTTSVPEDDPDLLKANPKPGYGLAGQFASIEDMDGGKQATHFTGRDWFQPVDPQTKKPVGLGYYRTDLDLSVEWTDLQKMQVLLIDHLLRKEVHTAVACCVRGAPVKHKESTTDFNLAEFKVFMAYLITTHDKWKGMGGEKTIEASILRNMLVNLIDFKIKVIDEALEKKQFRALRAGKDEAIMPEIKAEKEWLARLKTATLTGKITLPR
jgi:hypothetical protein